MKRKREAGAKGAGPDSSDPTKQPKAARKSTVSACLACKRAKRSCWAERPCPRCVKRGIPCVEVLDRRSKAFRKIKSAVSGQASSSIVVSVHGKSDRTTVFKKNLSKGARESLNAASSDSADHAPSDPTTSEDSTEFRPSTLLDTQEKTVRCDQTVNDRKCSRPSGIAGPHQAAASRGILRSRTASLPAAGMQSSSSVSYAEQQLRIRQLMALGPPLSMSQPMLTMQIDSRGGLLMTVRQDPTHPGLQALLGQDYNRTVFVPPAIESAANGVLLPDGARPVLPPQALQLQSAYQIQAHDAYMFDQLSRSPIPVMRQTYNMLTLQPMQLFMNAATLGMVCGEEEVAVAYMGTSDQLMEMDPISAVLQSTSQLGAIIGRRRTFTLPGQMCRHFFVSEKAKQEAMEFVGLVEEQGESYTSAARKAVAIVGERLAQAQAQHHTSAGASKASSGFGSASGGMAGGARARAGSGSSSTGTDTQSSLSGEGEATHQQAGEEEEPLFDFLTERVASVLFYVEHEITADWVGTAPRALCGQLKNWESLPSKEEHLGEFRGLADQRIQGPYLPWCWAAAETIEAKQKEEPFRPWSTRPTKLPTRRLDGSVQPLASGTGHPPVPHPAAQSGDAATPPSSRDVTHGQHLSHPSSGQESSGASVPIDGVQSSNPSSSSGKGSSGASAATDQDNIADDASSLPRGRASAMHATSTSSRPGSAASGVLQAGSSTTAHQGPGHDWMQTPASGSPSAGSAGSSLHMPAGEGNDRAGRFALGSPQSLALGSLGTGSVLDDGAGKGAGNDDASSLASHGMQPMMLGSPSAGFDAGAGESKQSRSWGGFEPGEVALTRPISAADTHRMDPPRGSTKTYVEAPSLGLPYSGSQRFLSPGQASGQQAMIEEGMPGAHGAGASSGGSAYGTGAGVGVSSSSSSAMIGAGSSSSSSSSSHAAAAGAGHGMSTLQPMPMVHRFGGVRRSDDPGHGTAAGQIWDLDEISEVSGSVMSSLPPSKRARTERGGAGGTGRAVPRMDGEDGFGSPLGEASGTGSYAYVWPEASDSPTHHELRQDAAGGAAHLSPADRARLRWIPRELLAVLDPVDVQMLKRKVVLQSELQAWHFDFRRRLQMPGSRLGEELTRLILSASSGDARIVGPS